MSLNDDERKILVCLQSLCLAIITFVLAFSLPKMEDSILICKPCATIVTITVLTTLLKKKLSL